MNNLFADIFCDSSGKKWTALVGVCNNGNCAELYRKESINTEYNAITAMESLWNKANSNKAQS